MAITHFSEEFSRPDHYSNAETVMKRRREVRTVQDIMKEDIQEVLESKSHIYILPVPATAFDNLVWKVSKEDGTIDTANRVKVRVEKGKSLAAIDLSALVRQYDRSKT